MIHNHEENGYSHWKCPPNHPQLKRGQVHLWRTNLNLSGAAVEQLADLLSEDELVRADKYRFLQHKKRFIVARGTLRQLLGAYLHVSPAKLEFAYGDRGKPSLLKLAVDHLLQFNISHSHEYALYGFNLDHPIGVDLEHIRPMPEAAKIAQRFFSPQEFQLISDLQGQQRQEAFFRLWTAKEAYLKSTGVGLAGSLADVDICLDHISPHLDLHSKTNTAAECFLYPCHLSADYVAAMVIQTKIAPQQINYWNWQ